MSFTEQDVRKIAKLARIGISLEEVDIFKNELSKILDMVEQLKEVDTDSVQPLYSLANNNILFREDQPIKNCNMEQILSNTNHKEFNCFRVPKVIE